MREYICKFINIQKIDIDSTCWEDAEIQYVEQYPWKSEERAYIPKTQFRLLHNKENLFVRFDVWEKNIRATYTQPNDPVCRDSCVEFFFCPDKDDIRYLSFEMNPLGTLLIGLGSSGDNLVYLTDNRKIFDIQSKIKKDFWQVCYTIPFEFIEKYYGKVSHIMRGNFMKCADQSNTPHHGCWNMIDTKIPMFHVPEFFGTIKMLQ